MAFRWCNGTYLKIWNYFRIKILFPYSLSWAEFWWHISTVNVRKAMKKKTFHISDRFGITDVKSCSVVVRLNSRKKKKSGMLKAKGLKKLSRNLLQSLPLEFHLIKNDFYVNFISFYKKEQEKKNVLQHRNRQDKIRVIDSFSRSFLILWLIWLVLAE